MLELESENRFRFEVHRRTSGRRSVRGALLLSIPLVCGFLTAAQAQIRTDGTLGRPAVGLAGPSFLITEALGRLAGSNLFYSFQVFNVGNAESATFITTTAGLTNMISRVTGGSPSQINGLISLQSTNAAPNFFFINPAGVVFGQGARIDVPAGFNVSTADYLKFPDGNFYADPKAVSTLSSAAPEAFGFLGSMHAKVTLNDNAVLSTSKPDPDLAARAVMGSPLKNQPISIVGGDIEIDNAAVLTNRGDIRLVAVGSGPHEVPLTGTPLDAFGNVDVLNGGAVVSSAALGFDGGNILVAAKNVTIDNGALLSTMTGTSFFSSSGNAGDLRVTATGDVALTNRGKISSEAGVWIHDGTYGRSGDVELNTAGNLRLLTGGIIRNDSSGSGGTGLTTIRAGTLTIDPQGYQGAPTGISAGGPPSFSGLGGSGSFFRAGKGGDVAVAVDGELSIVNGGKIIYSELARSGALTVHANTVTLDGQGNQLVEPSTGFPVLTEIGGFSSSIDVSVGGALTLRRGYLAGSGPISVKAGSLILDSDAGILGNGDIRIAVDGAMSMTRGGHIEPGAANNGTISVEANTLTIDSQGCATCFTGINSGSFNIGNAVFGGRPTTSDNIFVSVNAALSIANGGRISSTAELPGSDRIGIGTGNSGSVTVRAGTLLIDGQHNVNPTGIVTVTPGAGNGGNISVAVNGPMSLLNGGQISSNTLATATGRAGDVTVNVTGQISITNLARITSATYGMGSAGSIAISAGSIFGDSNATVAANALHGSSGQTGTVTVEARDGITLSNGASFSIENAATVANPASLVPTLLNVTAPNISLGYGSQFTAASSGNAAASGIRVNFGPQLTLSNASISTSANQGNGGSVAISGTGTLVLQNGQITTSVAGQQGNGGDISIQAPTLVMQTGFIQANTAAATANGGKVNIEVDALVPSGTTLFVGGPTPFTFAPGVFGFNVIQAAAPTGVSGTIQISTPVLDIIGSISALPAEFLDSGGLGRSPCAIVGGSSLSQVGRGGLPPRAGDLLWIDPIIEVPATPPAGAPRSGTAVPPYRAVGSNVKSKTNPCWS